MKKGFKAGEGSSFKMETTRYIRWGLFLLVLLVLLLLAAAWSLTSGEIRLSLFQLPAILKQGDSQEFFILEFIRIPRLVLAFSVGGALSLTGAVLQGIYRNPLVEPYTLGISGGASMGVALVVVTGAHVTMGILMLPFAGFAGALITIFMVYFLSLRNGGVNIHRMLLIGVMISFLTSSTLMFLMSVTTAENLHGIVFWMMGSLDEPNKILIRVMLISSLLGLAISYLFARPLNALRLGEAKALHLGINSGVSVRVLFVLSSLLAGACVAVAGVIGFVGLVIPHVVRLIIGSDYRILLLGSFLGGALFLICSDVIARTIISPNELPIGVITGMVGGVGFLIVLSRMKKSKTL
jgi:iron complex transport system permease protein